MGETTTLVSVPRGRVLVRLIYDKYSDIRVVTGFTFHNPEMSNVHHHTDRIVDYSQVEKFLHSEFVKTCGKTVRHWLNFSLHQIQSCFAIRS